MRTRAAVLRTAFHEAGHAVQAWIEGGRISEATIRPGVYFEGRVLARFPRPRDRGGLLRRGHAEAWGRTLLAGPAAQRRHRPGTHLRHGGRPDRLAACAWAEDITRSGRERDALLRLWLVQVEDSVERQWAKIEAVAAALVEAGTLCGPDVERICAEVHEKRIAEAVPAALASSLASR